MVSLLVVLMAEGPIPSPSLKMDSTTLSSVAVVSRPVTAIQSLTTIPAPTTGEPLLTEPATRGTCSSELNSSWSWMLVLGWTIPPALLKLMYEPTRTLSAIVCLKTSTPKTSAMISSVSRSRSGWTRATWSLQQMTLPSADRRSSMRWILTSSGMLLRKCCSSWSDVLVGTRRPLRLPAVRRPMMRVPAMVVWQMGITSWSSASKTLRRRLVHLFAPSSFSCSYL